jgi:hypothetical protein
MELRRDDIARAAGDRDRRRAERLGSTEREIRQAQAEALGRTGERLQRLLDQITAIDRRLDELTRAGRGPMDPELVGAETAARNRLRDEAARVRHHLVIQREALGLARHTPVEQCYPVPERRRVPEPPAGRGRES